MNAILSIKPQFVEEILAGKKKYEYRKSVFKQPVKKVYIYASAPVSRIVGEFEVAQILSSEPSQMWQQTKKYSGISKRFFDGYFNGRSEGYAIEIKNLVHYEHPVNPYVRIAGFHAPQSFCYVDEVSMRQ